MGAGDLANVLQHVELLVAYDCGMGGLWGVLVAPSQEAILKKYPELGIADDLPAWMNSKRLERLRQDRPWLEEPPQGILEALVADRVKT